MGQKSGLPELRWQRGGYSFTENLRNSGRFNWRKVCRSCIGNIVSKCKYLRMARDACEKIELLTLLMLSRRFVPGVAVNLIRGVILEFRLRPRGKHFAVEFCRWSA